MERNVRVVAVLAAFGASLAAGGMVTRRWGTAPTGPPGKARKTLPEAPVAHVAETAAPPKVDGKLDEPAWAKAPLLTLGWKLDGTDRAHHHTEVRLLRDKASLYAAIRCSEPLLDRLRAERRSHDGEPYRDDSVEIFLGTRGTYFHFGINAAGSTYDARGKDASWDSGLRAAVGRSKDGWHVELAIPLRAMVGEGDVPGEWTANFNRNRYPSGAWEETAWSPTYSGDSHVPARFGKLLFKDPPAAMRIEGVKVDRDSAVVVTQGAGGLGVVQFPGFDLRKGTRVHRADLLVFRTVAVDGRMQEAMTPIEILAQGKPLTLAPPLFDRFDATEAVRRCVAAGTPPAFLVKTCPFWNAGATCLDVAYEGEPADAPQPVARAAAFHRAGQTFVTWSEVEPPITAEKATWGEVKKLLAEPGPWRYRIYAHTKPITSANLHEAALVGEVGQLTAWNVNARNKEYLLGQAMARSDEMGELARDYNGYMHTWTMDSSRMDRYPVPRFVIDEKAGPLPPGTGLFVHCPTSAGTRCYAVVSVRDGVDSTKQVVCAAPVKETVGLGEPVRQGKGLWGPFFDYPGTRWVYVQWCGPPLAPRPAMAFNWSVLVPAKVEGKAPAELYFHPDGYSYAQPGKKLLLGSIQLAPHDWPASGWHGFNDAWGTLGSFKTGTVRNHTQKRILAFLEWAKATLPIDPDRVLAVGADGAAALALAAPKPFAAVYITGFDRNGVLEPKAAGKFAAAWGPKSPDIRDEQGRAEWSWAFLDELVTRGADLPPFICRGASWGREKGWGKGRGRFYAAMHKAGQPLVAHWAWGGRLPKPDKYTGLWHGIDLRRGAFVPAFSNCSLDQEGEGGGNTNMSFSWRDVSDGERSFQVTVLGRECTFDFTPRRLAKFTVKPGEKLWWEVEPLAGRSKEPAKRRGANATADEHGVVTIKALEIPRGSPGLTLAITRAK